ncbi:hypothetical protein AVO30_00265 [Yersinia pestis]|nr:hypothetical protein A1122_01785 [Yersinia pestis A1122]AJI92515.1 hypothetical protein CH59_1207 [Yersinia pestis]AJI97080.1 hypothetical protein BZ18_1696 [Yersinia pestis Pestoides F]AJJ81241.1 hypothetical protein CH58_1738 [Yersinia pestis Antiqua]AJJ84209.1 hypothetical protein CH56_1205 [Yersinia pestis Angola]AJJ86549.1 hypothetical protein AK38_1915 [Yersinia pestis CO92]AJK11740.1 hypothetical protein CH60_2999 [Yersinia pestis str. Pestoides B]AJK22888.1 hypothetical protein CH
MTNAPHLEIYRCISPADTVTLSHPDYNRRPRNYTGSADLYLALLDKRNNMSARGLLHHRRDYIVAIQFTAGGDFHPALRISPMTIALLIHLGNYQNAELNLASRGLYNQHRALY